MSSSSLVYAHSTSRMNPISNNQREHPYATYSLVPMDAHSEQSHSQSVTPFAELSSTSPTPSPLTSHESTHTHTPSARATFTTLSHGSQETTHTHSSASPTSINLVCPRTLFVQQPNHAARYSNSTALLALSVGIETAPGIYWRVIPQYTLLPCSMTTSFTNTEDYQKFINVSIYQGERIYSQRNRFIDSISIVDLPACPRGMLHIELTLSITHTGILTFSACWIHKPASTTITPTGMLDVVLPERISIPLRAQTLNSNEINIEEGFEVQQHLMEYAANREHDADILSSFQARSELQQYMNGLHIHCQQHLYSNILTPQQYQAIQFVIQRYSQWLQLHYDLEQCTAETYKQQLQHLRDRCDSFLLPLYAEYSRIQAQLAAQQEQKNDMAGVEQASVNSGSISAAVVPIVSPSPSTSAAPTTSPIVQQLDVLSLSSSRSAGSADSHTMTTASSTTVLHHSSPIPTRTQLVGITGEPTALPRPISSGTYYYLQPTATWSNSQPRQ